MEVGLAFLSAGLQVLFDRLAPQGELLNLFQKHKDGVQLFQKLRTTLHGLQVVLNDAENKQASDPCVSQWLNELRDAVDGAENLIEEVNYKALRLKVEGQHQNIAERRSFLQVIGLRDDFFRNIRKKLEGTIETLKVLQEQIGHLGLKEHFLSTKQETRTPSTSSVVESDIFGRQNEIEKLVGRLLYEDANGENPTVVPIVGMGGVGKTTLAQAVYNDKKVEKHFDLKAWVCVSESYDALRITKGLLQGIDSFDLKNDNSLDKLEVELKKRLTGERFLVVLDDVWDDDYNKWYKLRNLFVQGKIGSKIIVTTRKEGVAKMMGRGEINTQTLTSEASWALFKRHSLENRDPEEQQELEEVGKKIAHKCKGLPLALKALAGMLRSKSGVDEWRYILRSEIWELPNRSDGILPALMLSYNDLPAHLKRCFAYCAIYPKDYQFRKDQVIHLWIANGLVQNLESGNRSFAELRSRSLFERVPESSKRDVEEYLMHDLVNDLARIASSELCIRLEDNEKPHMLEKGRHLSYSMGYDGAFEKLKPLYKSERMRTLLPINMRGDQYPLSKRVLHNILPRLTSLRALSLSHYWINELPDALFVELKLLRFLDLSWTRIKQLPDSVCALYNLEILILSSCEYLEKLPLQMEKLINLRHLDISGPSCLKMPLPLSKLTNLHVLVGAKFLLGDCNGSRIGDLGELHNLYGSLSLLELQNVADRREALKANMREKNHVEKLSLMWSESIADNSQTEKDILDDLHPHTNIEELQITGYRGTNFPDWLYWLADHSFSKLVELSLSNCKDCYFLPSLGQLPSLKFLAIRGMDRIPEVNDDFYGSSSSKKPFNSLEKLEFAQMPEWKQWHVLGKGEFPALRDLSIEDCPKLIGKLPDNLCSLTRLKISNCPNLNLEKPIQLSNLKEFIVFGSPNVGVLFDDAELFTSQLLGMKQIVDLFIKDCQSLTSLPISILSNTLKTIKIYGCGKLKLEASVGEMFLDSFYLKGCDSIDDISPELVPRARYLRVKNCHSLTRLLIPTVTETLNIEVCENLERLTVTCGTQMTSLSIESCKKLKWLPERMQELLPSLKKLTLQHCPEIESFPEGGLPFYLEVLKIWNCKKLVNNRKEWHLLRLPCLRELEIEHDSSDEEILVDENWELPCSIQRLWIGNLKTLSSQVLKSLTSLEYLWTDNLPQIQSLLEEGLPSSLSTLILCGHDELHSLPMEVLLRLTSLQRLQIYDCPNLQSLPVNGMPSSISELSISDCPLLKPLLEFEKGEYWPNIAQIPTIKIDGEYQ